MQNCFTEFCYFSGHQYRTKSCFWGGHICPKQEKNGQDSKPYCNGSDIKVCGNFGPFKIKEIEDENRVFRSSPTYCNSAGNFLSMIGECDRGSSWWTYWLGWEIDAENDHLVERSRRRYCLLKSEECLFEEKTQQKCCKDTTCAHLPQCSFKPLEQ